MSHRPPLPDDYSLLSHDDIDYLLSFYDVKDLLSVSLEPCPLAQNAYVHKLVLGLHEFREGSVEERIDTLLDFWKIIKPINSVVKRWNLVGEHGISMGIIEIAMGRRMYSSTAPKPAGNVISMCRERLKDVGMPEKNLKYYQERLDEIWESC